MSADVPIVVSGDGGGTFTPDGTGVGGGDGVARPSRRWRASRNREYGTTCAGGPRNIRQRSGLAQSAPVPNRTGTPVHSCSDGRGRRTASGSGLLGFAVVLRLVLFEPRGGAVSAHRPADQAREVFGGYRRAAHRTVDEVHGWLRA